MKHAWLATSPPPPSTLRQRASPQMSQRLLQMSFPGCFGGGVTQFELALSASLTPGFFSSGHPKHGLAGSLRPKHSLRDFPCVHLRRTSSADGIIDRALNAARLLFVHFFSNATLCFKVKVILFSNIRSWCWELMEMLRIHCLIIWGVVDFVRATQRVKAHGIVLSNYLWESTELTERFSLAQVAEAEI